MERKNKALIKFVKKYHFDIFGLAETNVHWTLLDPTNGWEEQMQGVWECNPPHSIAFNENDEFSSACWSYCFSFISSLGPDLETE